MVTSIFEMVYLCLISINQFNRDFLDVIRQSWTNINTSYAYLISGERTRVFIAGATGSAKKRLSVVCGAVRLGRRSDTLRHQSLWPLGLCAISGLP